MRLYRKLLSFGPVTLLALATAVLPACSDKEAEPEEPAAEPTDAEAAAEPPAAEPADEEDAAATAEPAPEAVPAPAPAPTEPTGFDGAKVAKYVRAYALNVRTGPGKDFPVKRHVKYGEKIEVVINGDWAKLGEGEYVSTNRLSDKEPKKGRYK